MDLDDDVIASARNTLVVANKALHELNEALAELHFTVLRAEQPEEQPKEDAIELQRVPVSRSTLDRIRTAIETTSSYASIDDTAAQDGYQNVIVWPDPEEGFWHAGIVLCWDAKGE